MSVGIQSRNIDDLHPCVARGCRELIRRMVELGFPPMGINQTFRCAEHQDWLFAQGRPNHVPHGRPGNIVTNLRGGNSFHQWRVAFDFHRNVSGQAFNDRTPEERRFWDTAGRNWEEMGGVWGGNFRSFVDRPHCEYTGGLRIADFQAGRTLPVDAKMPWEEREDEVEMRFNTIQEIAIAFPWAVPTMQRLLDRRIFTGRNEVGAELDVSEDMIRLLVTLDRAGIFDK